MILNNNWFCKGVPSFILNLHHAGGDKSICDSTIYLLLSILTGMQTAWGVLSVFISLPVFPFKVLSLSEGSCGCVCWWETSNNTTTEFQSPLLEIPIIQLNKSGMSEHLLFQCWEEKCILEDSNTGNWFVGEAGCHLCLAKQQSRNHKISFRSHTVRMFECMIVTIFMKVWTFFFFFSWMLSAK